jgi:UDP-N-acetylmuramate--alanine ligase
MQILNYKLYYFLGVGGIGMSALARYFNHYGKIVYGYDKTESPLTKQLQEEGIQIHFEENDELLKSLLSRFEENEILFIYTPAIPVTNSELLYVQKHQLNLQKRAWVLGEITKQFKTIAIAGTHGKTTTTSLVTQNFLQLL